MRLSALLVTATLLTAGCTRPPRYSVYVTGYTGGAPVAIPAGASVAVIENARAKNVLLEQEVADKVLRALEAYGFRPAAPGEADVAVTVEYGSDTRVAYGEELRFDPGQTSTIKDSTGKVIGTVTGSSSFSTQPTATTQDLVWLTLTARNARALRDSATGKPLWIGEAKNQGANLDLRSAIDVLVGPVALAFGHNQSQRRIVVTDEDSVFLAVRRP